jgi:hypothetical protein
MENQAQLNQALATLTEALSQEPFGAIGFKQSADKNRQAQFFARYFGYKIEIEFRLGKGWLVLFGWSTSPALVEHYNEVTGDSKKGRDVISFDTAEEAVYYLGLLVEGIQDTAVVYGLENGRPTQSGVSFNETNFAGYGERDFMAAVIQIQKSGYASVIPSVGSKLGFEYVVASTNSRIDAVEFNEAGEVVTVIECQSGIQNGNYLDPEHFEKAISRYPQSAEIRNTVRQIVIIAGGYSAEQLATFGQLPYEIVALVTKVENGQIVLEKAN